jgi:FlaG/FlaF family flagellin (archaellin)
MVAITVILAAVIGTFVLGLGENLQDTSPTASITFDQESGPPGASVKISHDGGDSLDTDRITLILEKNDGSTGTLDNGATDWSNNEITAGDTVTVAENDGDDLNDGDTVKVVWTSDSGETSSVLGEHTVN